MIKDTNKYKREWNGRCRIGIERSEKGAVLTGVTKVLVNGHWIPKGNNHKDHIKMIRKRIEVD